MRDAEVYIVPLRIGGGTRLKIFEAMAMGKAVVSTTIGAEGLPVRDGEHLLIADEPRAFAQGVVIPPAPRRRSPPRELGRRARARARTLRLVGGRRRSRERAHRDRRRGIHRPAPIASSDPLAPRLESDLHVGRA